MNDGECVVQDSVYERCRTVSTCNTDYHMCTWRLNKYYYLICFCYCNAILFAACDDICPYLCKGTYFPLGFEGCLVDLFILYLYFVGAQAIQRLSGACVCQFAAAGRVLFVDGVGVGSLDKSSFEQFALLVDSEG